MASDACCAAGAPLKHNYTRKGTMSTLADGTKLYLKSNGPRAILFVHDIFGFDCNQVRRRSAAATFQKVCWAVCGAQQARLGVEAALHHNSMQQTQCAVAQVFQVADRLSEQGYSVAVPDFFGDNTWPLDKFPPPENDPKYNQDEFMKWVKSAGDVDGTSKKVKMVQEHMKKEHSATQFGIVGFCWGGGVSLHLASARQTVQSRVSLACNIVQCVQPSTAFASFRPAGRAAGDTDFKGVACCHPAFFGKEKEFAAAAQVPVCFLPSKDDPMDDPKAELDKKPFASQCFYHRFDEQMHGFMAGRGDFSDEKVSSAAGKGIELLNGFFDKVMTAA